MDKEHVCLYNKIESALLAGIWTLETQQKITDAKGDIVNKGEDISASQKIIIDYTLTGLSQGTIVNRFPLPNSEGAYTTTVPHVILKDARLPWRTPIGENRNTPCVALLLFTRKEQEQNIEFYEATMEEFCTKKKDNIYTPKFHNLSAQSLQEHCRYMRITTKLFDKVCPTKEELSLLAHCRQVYIGDKAELNLDPDGLFAVILSLRIPQYQEDMGNTDYIACLVSIEGMEEVLGGKATETKLEFIDVIVLDTYSFSVNGMAKNSFRLFCQKSISEALEPPMLALSQARITGIGAKRLSEGYVPLLYHLRTGDEGMGWYRSPLTPLPVLQRAKESPFESSDSALCYDKVTGVFDVSKAVAWEAGRIAALQEASFTQNLMHLRVRGQELTDRIMAGMINRMRSPDEKELVDGWQKELEKVSDEEIKSWLIPMNGGEQFFSAFTNEQLDMLTVIPSLDNVVTPEGSTLTADVLEEMEHLCRELMLRKAELISSLLNSEARNTARWLAKLWLLYPISFDTLVPHRNLLPPESIRFFFIDESWLEAAYEGAVSLGMDSSRQSCFNRMIRKLLLRLTHKEMLNMRASLYGETAPQPKSDTRSGLLIRSSLVTYWPTLSMAAFNAQKQSLAILRMELLSEDIMIILFDGVAETIRCIEPKECIQMEIDKTRWSVSTAGKMNLSASKVKTSSELALKLMSAGDCATFKGKGE